ncbi:alpha/beta hydrolase [soil metagenome]
MLCPKLSIPVRLIPLLFFVAVASNALALTKLANLRYADRNKHALGLDLFLPDTPPPAAGYPLIISFHGGGWALGNKHNDLFLRPLVAQGYALASVDYRLSGQAPFPAQIEDCRDAVHWLLRQADALKLDRNRIAVTGISAGGHLALLLAFSEGHWFVAGGSAPLPPHTIKAVVSFYPPTDLISIVPPKSRDSETNLVALLLGGSVNKHLALAREGSPITYVKAGSPPVFLVHGDRDKTVPLDQSLNLARALKEEHTQVSLQIYQGKGHAFWPRKETMDEIGKFLRARLN